MVEGRKILPKSIVVPVAGMTLLWPSVFNGFRAPLPSSSGILSESAEQVVLIVFSITLVAFSLIAFFASRRFELLMLRSRITAVISCMLGTLGTILINTSDIYRHETISIVMVGVGITFVGIYVVVAFLYWSSHFHGDNPQSYLVSAVASCVLSSLLIATRLSFGFNEALLNTIFSLVQTALVLADGLSENHLLTTSSFKISSLKKLQLALLIPSAVFTYLCLAGIMLSNMGIFSDGFGPSEQLPYKQFVYWFDAVVFVVIGFICYQMKQPENTFNGIFGLLAILLVAAMLLAVVFSSIQTNMASLLFISGRSFFEAFIWLVLVFEVNRRRLSPTMVFGLFVVAIIAIPKLIKTLITLSTHYLSYTSDTIIIFFYVAGMSLLTVTIAVCVFLYFMQQLTRRATERHGVKQAQAVTLAGQEHGLSRREVEIVSFTYRGYNAKSIADELFIAESTVYTHLKRIYRKLGIHSKQDLIRLVDGFK
jgi:DNA-binding CsgD family transcriptional regulator